MVTIVGSWSKTLRNIFNPDFKSHVLHFWQNSSCKGLHWFALHASQMSFFQLSLTSFNPPLVPQTVLTDQVIWPQFRLLSRWIRAKKLLCWSENKKKKTNLGRRFVFWWWNKNMFFLTSYVVFCEMCWIPLYPLSPSERSWVLDGGREVIDSISGSSARFWAAAAAVQL